jgi:hypothetical protein
MNRPAPQPLAYGQGAGLWRPARRLWGPVARVTGPARAQNGPTGAQNRRATGVGATTAPPSPCTALPAGQCELSLKGRKRPGKHCKHLHRPGVMPELLRQLLPDTGSWLPVKVAPVRACVHHHRQHMGARLVLACPEKLPNSTR